MRSTMRTAAAMALAVALAAGSATSGEAHEGTRSKRLLEIAARYEENLAAMRGESYDRLKRSEQVAARRLNDDASIELAYVTRNGRPFYHSVENLDAARTISTDLVWPGGGPRFALTGSGTLPGELAVWDGGAVLVGHQEFEGRVVQIDTPDATSFHATHVAGTMVAGGVVQAARGMSYDAPLDAYDWVNDDGEMAAAAAGGLVVSNHSYGYVTGWYWNDDWYWFGDTGVSETEDYGFGFYCDAARAWDEIAWNAPTYTIVKSAGNDRSDAGPGPGGGHWVYDRGWKWSTATREPDGGHDGYDTIAWNSTAKNIIAVGAVDDIAVPYTGPSQVAVTSFSGWGPTDDGRIKPDLVANGVGLYSAVDSGPTDYATYSGTSMSSPNLSGSINLLVGYYRETHGPAPLSSTVKAILIHTADESGPADGPDYMHGWGLANIERAATLIGDDSSDPGLILEQSLSSGESASYHLAADGLEPLVVTLAWTDPPGPLSAPSLDPGDPKLVHDLDLRIERARDGAVYRPYVLDPSDPAAAATTGDNDRDNTEKIEIGIPEEGDYIVTVSHKGALTADQSYSLASSVPLTDVTTGVPDAAGPKRLLLAAGNFPNPFNPTTAIRFTLARPSPVSVDIFDVAGRRVRVLRDGETVDAGTHDVVWDGRNDEGDAVASGIYYYTIASGEAHESGRMVLLK